MRLLAIPPTPLRSPLSKHDLILLVSRLKKSRVLSTDQPSETPDTSMLTNTANTTPVDTARSSQKLKDLLAEEAAKSQMVEKGQEATPSMMISSGGTHTSTVSATPNESPTEKEEEDREHLTHFKSWGAAAPRSTPSQSSIPS